GVCGAADVRIIISGGEQTAGVNKETAIELKVQHSGECDALNVIATNILPAGGHFIRAEYEQGAVEHSDRTVTWRIGRMVSAQIVSSRIFIQPRFAGSLTNIACVSASNAIKHENPCETVVIEVDGPLPFAGPRLSFA